MHIKINGKCGISATVIADSINEFGNRMITYELIYPRFIHSELMTHRMLSKNAASSRAVPYATNVQLIEESPAMPVHWGKNQPGMKAKEELDDITIVGIKGVWLSALKTMMSVTRVMNDAGLHKQVINRLLEPWSMMKTVISGTEWENFFWLRYHPDAQPEFQELAKCAKKAMEQSSPRLLEAGEWHLPYVVTKKENGVMTYWSDEETELTLKEAQTVSMSCCAQVSYRRLDDTLEKAMKIYDMLNIGSKDKPSHASPLEHLATPMKSANQYTNTSNDPLYWEEGVTHMRKDMSLWSGNLRGWIQYRQLVPGEAVW